MRTSSATLEARGVPPEERPLRSELFSTEQLQRHGSDLAQHHRLAPGHGKDRLLARLAENEALLQAFNQATLRAEERRRTTPAAEWLIDNCYLIEEQIRTARRHLPRSYSRELPHLEKMEHPRVCDLALEFVAHVDGRIDAAQLSGFIAAYQTVTRLKLGELWAIPIMLRLALVENLRRVAVLLSSARAERDRADEWADRLVETAEDDPAQLITVVGALAAEPKLLTRSFVAELCRRLHQTTATVQIVFGWLEQRLALEDRTIEQLVQEESQDQAADQVSVANSINSLRTLDAINWAEFVETLSAVEQALRQDPAGVYGKMSFASRDACRHAVERIAKRCPLPEWDVAARAVDLARSRAADAPGDLRLGHVGFFLLDEGVEQFEGAVGLRRGWLRRARRFLGRHPLSCFLGSIVGFTSLLTLAVLPAASAAGLGGWRLVGVALPMIICASQLAVAMVNWLATLLASPRLLPRMNFSEGIPADQSAMIAIPTLLTSPERIESLLDDLEIRYLANRDPNLFFALLTDFRDAPTETLAEDEDLLRRADEGIRRLNERYPKVQGDGFFLFHRPRQWNAAEGKWMGYERKRGKLVAFTGLLRGRNRECFSRIVGDLGSLPSIKSVLTLDADTQLPRDAARELVGTIAHPLNRPQFDPVLRRVTRGYGLLQPRVAVNLACASRTYFARLFCGEPGLDPYTRAVSDVYQDLFGEGSFIGKGIYDVDTFEQALAETFPPNRILSHDLLESGYVRSALVSDVQLFEDFPSHYLADLGRRQRWMRGDWQIWNWISPRVPGANGRGTGNPLAPLARWKIFDNLRRSLVPVALLAVLILGWVAVPRGFPAWEWFALAVLAAPVFLVTSRDLLRKPKELFWSLHLRQTGRAAVRQAGQALCGICFLPAEGLSSLDAILRTFGRLWLTRRHLLEWQTASEAARRAPRDVLGFCRSMWAGPVLGIGLIALLARVAPGVLPWAGPLLVLWIASPMLAWWLSRPVVVAAHKLSAEQLAFLDRCARKTWRFFETFVTEADNWLPPDNFQERPGPILAQRTSPTNIGLSLLSNLSAWDLGYISAASLLQRTEHTLAVVQRMERHEGHFYNWYETHTLRPLPPLYLSTVDNGNFAAFVLALQGGLAEMGQQKILPGRTFHGLRATLGVLQEEMETHLASRPKRASADITMECRTRLEELAKILAEEPAGLGAVWSALKRACALAGEIQAALEKHPQKDLRWWSLALRRGCEEHLKELTELAPWIPLPADLEFLSGEARRQLDAIPSLQEVERLPPWLASLSPPAPEPGREPAGAGRDLMKALRSQCLLGAERARQRIQWSQVLAQRCAELADLDFTHLYNPARELLSVGYNVSHHRLDATCYDLLASEARLTSYVAIALGQLKQEHWFAMGRLLVSQSGLATLISWSGSMFEYLMPLLVLPVYGGTLLDSSHRGAVARQIEYGKQRGVPWGMSESGYQLTDAQLNYQYRAFGVPGLGLKRGLAEDLVIAPYASALALLVAPEEACRNLERLCREGREGRYGFYEAVDYTPARLPPNETSAAVQSFMAHHQAMSFLSFNALLLAHPMRRRFRSNPLLRANELLLQERVPKQTTVLHAEEVDVRNAQRADAGSESTLRVFKDPGDSPPEVHLLSNGRCLSMVTSAGGGYCRWKEIALTRWREDPTRDDWGTFVYLRDVDRGQVWSPTHQPVLRPADHYEALFSQGRAEFRASHNGVETHLQICISPEDDVEVRHLSILNQNPTRRTIELTSFAEVALDHPAAEEAHPAFSKLFLHTRVLREHHAILCSRRRRAPGEEWPTMFHLMLMDGPESGEASFETDRARFLGRGRTAADPVALAERAPAALSNTDGPVLDPCVAIRRTLLLKPRTQARAMWITGVAADEAAARALIEKYQDIQSADRAIELSWTHGLVVLRHLNATEADAQLFGRLAGGLVYANPWRRADPGAFAQNRRGRHHLWSYGISGDLPIVLLRVHRTEGLELVRQMVQAHAYWRLKWLAVDLVILNEDDSNYRQELHDQIMGLIASGMEAQLLDRPGGVFVRRAELVPREDQILLQAVARVCLSDDKGTLARQLQKRRRPEAALPRTPRPRRAPAPETESVSLPSRELVFANGLGGFTPDGREYVITLGPGQATPAPWVNVMANPEFGTVVSAGGGAYTWSENSHEFRLTPWENDAVTEASGEAFYVRDEQTRYFWSPSPAPARGATPYVTRHGFGYTVFEHSEYGILTELTVFVATDAPVKFAVLKLRNRSGRARSLTVTGYWEWVLGDLRAKNLMHVVTEIDPKSQALLARNAFNSDFPNRVAWVDLNLPGRSMSGDREEFLGRNGRLANPAAMSGPRLSGKVGAGLDPCAALQVQIELARDEEREIVFRLGAAKDLAEAQRLIHRFREPHAARVALQAVGQFWERTLGTVWIETPDAALNVLTNGWLVYQTLACRLWARTGFYQSGGAFGFRDQLQDVMALVYTQPGLVREHLLRAAAHQFRDGDVQHWWHPPGQRGVRTRCSDDYLWLPYATAHYVRVSGDSGVLEETVPFLEGRVLRPGEESFYDQPNAAGGEGSLYEHCVRAIRHAFAFGEHGLPLMGCGDWNDGMNLVGIHGRGESVWLACFLYDVLTRFAEVARSRQDAAFAKECVTEAARLRENFESHAWDGQWYRRAYFDNGVALGSAASPECQIDALPQSWSVISGIGARERAAAAMAAVEQRLVHRGSRLIQLFDPPFDQSTLEPGYIKGYLPGVRENGGQYTHAAVWTVMAFALLGRDDQAWDLLALLNPILHAATRADVARYQVEPYVVAADVYGAAPHTGRGGWTWYTGSAGWLYRLILEVLLGVEVKGDRLRLAPRLPARALPCRIRYRYRETVYHLELCPPQTSDPGPAVVTLDGKDQPDGDVPLCDDGKEHRIVWRRR